MSDREAFEKWLQREMPAGTVISDPLWWAPKIWQAAQAQAGSITKNQISEGIFGWGLRNDDGHNLSMDDTDEIAEYIMKQAREAGNE